MGKRIFTAEQESAIETRDKTLLVSAAAGSGKTATLTERIIRSITDEKNPTDINRLLIVTFTNAAVAELRERISTALKEKLREEPENKRLEHQLYMLPSARISTIDSFCNDILKNNTERFGISPRYRIADPIEANLLAHSIWSAMIEAAYSGELDGISPEEFEELSSCLTGVKKDSALEEVFAMLYEKSKSHEHGASVFRFMAEKLCTSESLPLEESPYVQYAMGRVKKTAQHYSSLIKEIAKDFEPDDRYLDSVSSDIILLGELAEANSYEKTSELLNSKIPALPSIRGDKNETQELYRKLRENMKEALGKDCALRYFTYSKEEWAAHTHKLHKLVTLLAKFIELFDTAYFEEKKSRAILEYSDIERLTYLALYNEDGSISELARSMREEYSAVYIDEYQDVNSLQNKIFLAVSKDNNRFTVGDIKQSIYGFRSARPDIFSEMKNSYPMLEEAGNSNTASIFMSKNFRCDRGIIDFVNSIFDTAFSLCADSIGYVSDDRLCFAKIYENGVEPPYKAPKIQLFAKPEEVDSDSQEEIKQNELAPKWTANKIKDLLENGNLNSGEQIKPNDIAIILRKGGHRAKLYTEELEKLGIKVRAAQDKNFFLNPEIQLALCLLNTINNPMKDIYLAGLMLSPLYSFTADELYFARRVGGTSLWDSVKLYSESHPQNAKFSFFINSINRYRSISEGMQVDALLLRLYSETGIMALAARGNGKENLLLLYNYARKFESSSFEGLYSFINYVNTVIESGAEFSTKKEEEDENAVTVMTVHKSKGLEFPVVFLADAGSALISPNERTARVAYSEDYGIAFRTRSEGGLALVESPIYNVIIDANVEKSIEEELRVYYVALTRAREELYVVGAPKTASREDYLASAKLRKAHISPYSLKEMKTFVDIVYLADTNADISWIENITDKIDTGAELSNGLPSSEQTSLNSEEKADNEFDKLLYSNLRERFNYEYPEWHLTVLPEKMSISNLYPNVLDGTEEEPRLSIDSDARATKKNKKGRLPEFITGSSEHESARRGIATHNFLQFFDLERFAREGAEAELAHLSDDDFISPDNAKRVRMNEIKAFANSQLFLDMRRAKRLRREFRFSLMLPAALFTQDEKLQKLYGENKILLQGVIDCIIENGDGSLHLVDYKTDRLTKEELADKALAQKSLSDRHSLQLTYYALAIEKIFGKLPDSVRIYSLPLGDTVDVKMIDFENYK